MNDCKTLLEDMRRLLQLYGPFHVFSQNYAKENWDCPGFAWPASWMFVRSFLGIL